MTLLIDYHGVISDGERLPLEWQRLLGDFFAPRYGKSATVWASANMRALGRSIERQRALQLGAHAEEFRRADRIEWLRDMLRFAEVPAPGDDLEADALAREAIAYVVPRARAAVPGAAEALRVMRARGFVLFTASGDHSMTLDGYLSGLGIRALFRETYGADLLGVWKNGPRFYETLLAHAQIDPADAVTLDDDASRLDWARDLGMETILVGGKDAGSDHRRIGTIAQLPQALAFG
jgi:HAD superfamily hydrolase (TIGR01509 family)